MKKKTIIICLTLLIGLSVKGQLNPIKNMQWNHWYLEPMNCFNLSWTKPDSSLTDTLIGYNIYRDDSLYIFTTDLMHDCDPCIGAPDSIFPFCNFLDYNIGQFYIHVTAVYNYSRQESIFTDSILNLGIMIGIKENLSNKSLTISNITQQNTSIMIELNNSIEHGEVIIYSLLGQEMTMTALNNQRNAEIDISNLSCGLYLLNLRNERICLTRKILIK